MKWWQYVLLIIAFIGGLLAIGGALRELRHWWRSEPKGDVLVAERDREMPQSRGAVAADILRS